MTAGFELIIETRRRSDVLEEVVTTKCCLPFSIYLTYAMVERLALFICAHVVGMQFKRLLLVSLVSAPEVVGSRL